MKRGPKISILSNSLITLRGRDFLSISDLDRDELLAILDLADMIKSGTWSEQPLAGRHVAMLFQKPSMRTRVSFEVGISRLGGHSVALSEQDVQIGQRETVADAARVLDRYVDLVVARLRRHQDLLDLAATARVPVVNALTELEHPCQVLADLMTIRERCGRLKVPVAFVGDGNNMVTSLAQAHTILGFPLTVITPPGYEPAAAVREAAPGMVVSHDRSDVAGARVIYTDVWTSMGFEAEAKRRRSAFGGYQVDAALLRRAPGAIFMHCLPAHRGEEVSDEVIDGPSSVVFDQAENRLHVQMALLALLA
jgi:ornithine carbamoyltransferase